MLRFFTTCREIQIHACVSEKKDLDTDISYIERILLVINGSDEKARVGCLQYKAQGCQMYRCGRQDG